MSASSSLPRIDSVPSSSAEQRAQILDLLFEPSTQLHTLSVPFLHEKTFESYNDLISAVGMQLSELSESASTSDAQWLESILGSHPRLGAKKVDSAQSQAEQAQLQGSGEEAEQLRKLNEEYESKFPGLRYVVFVNGRSRQAIMDDMRKRIDSSSIATERAGAIRVSSPFPYKTARVLSPPGDVRDCSRSCCNARLNYEYSTMPAVLCYRGRVRVGSKATLHMALGGEGHKIAANIAAFSDNNDCNAAKLITE
ncbi:hypothetical protein LTR85_004353 [Meristemomyces frigidus]|nr:hypothetical protein LTR85_004353 [Meristemomyces frigidus]